MKRIKYLARVRFIVPAWEGADGQGGEAYTDQATYRVEAENIIEAAAIATIEARANLYGRFLTTHFSVISIQEAE